MTTTLSPLPSPPHHSSLSSLSFSFSFSILQVLEKYQGELNEMGFSGLAGVCSGYCLKRVSQEVAVGIGAVFMLLQGLQHAGYININYKKLNADVTKVR